MVQAEIPQVLGIIYEQFLREATTANEHTRREFHQMKCYSLQIKDLDFHYKRMSTMYYKLNSFNDPSLNHVFVASLPKEIQPELQRQFTIHQPDIANLSLKKIYQLAVNCLKKLCEQKEFFKDLMKTTSHSKALAKHLISPSSVKVTKIALVRPRKNPISRNIDTHIRKIELHPDPKNPTAFFEKKILPNPQNPKAVVVSSVRKKGHFARNCLNCPSKSVRLIEHLQSSLMFSVNDDVKSFFSEQEDYDEQTTFVLTEDHSDPESVSVI